MKLRNLQLRKFGSVSMNPRQEEDKKGDPHNMKSTYLITPCSRALLEKLTGLQIVKKIPAFSGTPKFITAFTSARHLSLS
jgi:hypothetical protein